MAYAQHQQQYAPPQQQQQQYAPPQQQQYTPAPHMQQGYGGGGFAAPHQQQQFATNAAWPSPSDPVRLASRADVAKIHQLLVTSSRRALRATLSDAPEHERLAAEGDLDARVGEVMSLLLSATTFGGGDGENGGEEGFEFDAAAAVAAAATASAALAPADAELAALQAEADARAARVAALRAAAPRALRAAMAQRMAADDERAAKKAERKNPKKAGEENDGSGDGDDDPPPPAPLGASFAATLATMPGLRARVEEAADRLERAVEAMEAEASAPASGMTAELYYPLQERSKQQQAGGSGERGQDAAMMTEEEEGAAAARALAAHARACLPR